MSRQREDDSEVRLALEQSSVILQHIADAVTAQDPSGRLVYANAAARRLLGLADGARTDADPVSIFGGFDVLDEHGAPLPPERLPGRLVLDGAPQAEALVRWRRRGSREERWTMVRSCPVKDDRGRVRLAINIVQDVTQRRRAIERMMLLDEAGAILTALYPPDEMVARLAQLLVARLAEHCRIEVRGEAGRRHHVTLSARDRLSEELLHAVDDARRTANEVGAARRTTAAGHAIVAAPLMVHGESLGSLALVSPAGVTFDDEDMQLAADLAQRAALAFDNARMMAETREAAELRKDLVAVVAHDLKNPLNAITMAAALLGKLTGDSPEAARARKHGNIVLRAADRMNRLIHDLLDVAAIDAGALKMEPQPVGAGQLVHEAYDLMAHLAQQKSLKLERVVPAEPMMVLGDRERLLQVFSNLVGNAIKFTPAGGSVQIRATARPGCVQFSVADSGPGIEHAHLPHVFDRYWRVRKHSRDGTGLGLSIVKGIIEAHGGSVSVDTVPGVGATFHFNLPHIR